MQLWAHAQVVLRKKGQHKLLLKHHSWLSTGVMLPLNKFRQQLQHRSCCPQEYERHFLAGEFVAGREYEARLSKTMLPLIRPQDLQEVAQQFALRCSCIVQASCHRRCSPGCCCVV